MKKLAIISLALTIASPALASSTPDAEQASHSETSISDAADADNATANAIAADETVAPSANNWGALDDTSRYLLIMGTNDGFAAAGSGTPCFPGKDNSMLVSELTEIGFDSSDPIDLTEGLVKIAQKTGSCASHPKRGYNAELLRTMPDNHLALYLTGAVRGYGKFKSCPVEHHAYAAATAAAAIITSEGDVQPATILAEALQEGCAGVPDNQ